MMTPPDKYKIHIAPCPDYRTLLISGLANEHPVQILSGASLPAISKSVILKFLHAVTFGSLRSLTWNSLTIPFEEPFPPDLA